MNNNLTKETIVVEAAGKYGPKVNGVFYSLSTKSNLRPEQFQPGKTFDVLIYTTPASGKKYINQIIGEGTPVVTSAPLPSCSTVTIPNLTADVVTKTTDKETYWKEKNDSQKLGGLFHDAAELTASLVMANGLKTPEALKAFEEVLSGIIAIRVKLD